jgi:hypothetical protein
MHWRDALLRLRALLFRRQVDEELQEELQPKGDCLTCDIIFYK